MEVETERYIRKPLYVDAVRVTAQNFDDIATWCQGEIMTDEVPGTGTTKKYIKVRVHNPKNPRQTKAFIGDWILYTDRGYKVYTNKAFRAAFDLVEQDGAAVESITPVTDERVDGHLVPKFYIDPATGGLTESMPDVDTRPLGFGELMAIVRNELVGEEPSNPNQSTLEEADVKSIESVERTVPVDPELLEDDPGPVDEVVQAQSRPPVQTAVDDHTTPQGDPHEYVEATPEAIAEVVNEQQPPESEAISEQTTPMTADVEDATRGKQVLSEAEQQSLGPDKVRDLVSSGDAILAQDLAQSA